MPEQKGAENPQDRAIKSVLLTRHGLSEHNLREDVFMGRSPESRLLPEGEAQARRLGNLLKKMPPLDLVVASSLPRTLATARCIIAQLPGAPPLHSEQVFWELSKGDWEGQKPKPLDAALEAVRLRDPQHFRYGQGGESYAELSRRVLPCFRSWVESLPPGGRILFVLHGDVIHALLQHLLPASSEADPTHIKPCGLYEFRLPAQQASPPDQPLRVTEVVRLNA